MERLNRHIVKKCFLWFFSIQMGSCHKMCRPNARGFLIFSILGLRKKLLREKNTRERFFFIFTNIN